MRIIGMRAIKPTLGLFIVAALGCGDDNAVGQRDAEPTRDVGLDLGPPPVDAAPPPMRAHDATIADFGAPEEREPPAALTAMADEFPGDVRFFARNLTTGQTFARGADEQVYVGNLMRIMPVLAYARQVAEGIVSPDDTTTLAAEDVRHGVGLGSEEVGGEFRLEDLARGVMVDGDRTAEELLVEAVGGVNSVNSTISGLRIAGIGRYATPCERDREFAQGLDARFLEVECPALSAYVHGADTSGLTPAPFDVVPTFDQAAVQAAWSTFGPRALGSATAAALARVLAQIDDGTALSPEASARVRRLLDATLGDGGPGDMIPAVTWVGNVSASVYAGRHWMGLVRGGDAPYLFVALSDHHTRPPIVAVELFTQLADNSYAELVGPDSSWPPVVPARPGWAEAVLLLDAEAARACDQDTPNDFDAVLACRQAHTQDAFTPESATGGTIFLRGAPPVDVAWFWSRPDGARRRYQVQFSSNNWWIWTRTLRVLDPGTWHFAVLANGQAVHSQPFEVR